MPKHASRILNSKSYFILPDIRVHYSLFLDSVAGPASSLALRGVNWLLPPAGSNLNTLKKSCHSVLECLSVPGFACSLPIAGSEPFDVITSEKRHHLWMPALKLHKVLLERRKEGAWLGEGRTNR